MTHYFLLFLIMLFKRNNSIPVSWYPFCLHYRYKMKLLWTNCKCNLLLVWRISFKNILLNTTLEQDGSSTNNSTKEKCSVSFVCIMKMWSRMHFPAYLCRTHTDLLKEWIGWCLEKSSRFKLYLESMSCVKMSSPTCLLLCAKAIHRGWKHFFKDSSHTVQTCACVMTDSMCKSQHERIWQTRLKCFLACRGPCSSFLFF